MARSRYSINCCSMQESKKAPLSPFQILDNKVQPHPDSSASAKSPEPRCALGIKFPGPLTQGGNICLDPLQFFWPGWQPQHSHCSRALRPQRIFGSLLWDPCCPTHTHTSSLKPEVKAGSVPEDRPLRVAVPVPSPQCLGKECVLS